jgi:hypothetical protein
MTTPDPYVMTPVEVVVKNWTDNPAKTELVKRTTVHTYVLDPANVNVPDRYLSICGYEPNRVRMVVDVIDAAIALTTEVPKVSPDTSAAGVAPQQGRYLPTSAGFDGYTFFGPDAMWINSLAAVTRVTVTKEYT